MSENNFNSWDERLGEGVHQGFSVKFANGFEISVTWHSNSRIVRSTGENVAEIAIMSPQDDWDVRPFSTPEEIAQIMAEVAARKA